MSQSIKSKQKRTLDSTKKRKKKRSGDDLPRKRRKEETPDQSIEEPLTPFTDEQSASIQTDSEEEPVYVSPKMEIGSRIPAPKKPLENWNQEETFEWIEAIIGTQAESLRDQELDGEALIFLKDKQLREYGIKLGPAAKLMQAIKEQKNKTFPVSKSSQPKNPIPQRSTNPSPYSSSSSLLSSQQARFLSQKPIPGSSSQSPSQSVPSRPASQSKIPVLLRDTTPAPLSFAQPVNNYAAQRSSSSQPSPLTSQPSQSPYTGYFKPQPKVPIISNPPPIQRRRRSRGPVTRSKAKQDDMDIDTDSEIDDSQEQEVSKYESLSSEDDQPDADVYCWACWDPETYPPNNQIVFCDACDVTIHQSCQGPRLAKVPAGKWLCDKCDNRHIYRRPRCSQCNKRQGAMWFFNDTKTYIHCICATWIDDDKMKGQNMFYDRWWCFICGDRGGCIKCSWPGCDITYHPYCAMDDKSSWVHMGLG